MNEFAPYIEEKKRGRNSKSSVVNPEVENLIEQLKDKLTGSTEDSGYKQKYDELLKEHKKVLRKLNAIKKLLIEKDETKEESE